ncbi:MAG: 2TM domain-containing protein [Opitutales bacterium]
MNEPLKDRMPGDIESAPHTSEEVTRIIHRALSLQRTENGATRQDLSEIAREFGISPENLNAAIQEEEKDKENLRIREFRARRRIAAFRLHLSTYLFVMSGLFLINLLMPGGWWFHWPLLGWGLGLAFHARSAFFPTEWELDEEEG